MTAPPTAQEVLEAFDEIENDCSMPMGKTPPSIAAALDRLRAFIEHAAEADAWAKIEAWCKKNEHALHVYPPDPGMSLREANLAYQDKRFTGPTRLAALQLAAAWCEKEGA